MINREQQLTSDVMRRVHFIHTMRYFLTPSMIKGLVFLASCVGVICLVSIAHVIDNMSHLTSVTAYAPYIFGAYLHTSFYIQSIIVLALAAGAWLVGDIYKNFRYGRMHLKEA